MESITSEAWDAMWLPYYPYASDNLADGLERRTRPLALTARYIEANPQSMSSLLVVDVDSGDAVMRAMECIGSHPIPNVIVENPENGHAHAIWQLTAPVTRTEYARRKPVAFATAVTEGLRRAVDGDTGYSGLITKNPLHGSWDGMQTRMEPYTLEELRDGLGAHMPPPRWLTTQRANPVGLGRNCTIFETARFWAYREIRNHWGDSEGLAHAIRARVNELNTEYSVPLPSNEANDIANSISRWITTRSNMWTDGQVVYEATFATIQSARGKKGGVKSGESRRSKEADLIKQLKEIR